MSFGYGLQLSLLQLARAYTVLTHDGELLPVSFEKQAVAPKGKRVIKASTAKKVRELMVSVTEAGVPVLPVLWMVRRRCENRYCA